MLKCCCGGYVIFLSVVFLVTCYVNCELFGWADIYAGCSCGGSIGVVGAPVFHPLSLCLEVYLLSTVLFGTHPLLLQIFVGY